MKHRYLLVLILPLLAGACWQRMMNTVSQAPALADRLQLLGSAEEGNVESQYMLAKSYCCGTGVYFDNEMALYWWCEAAKQGQADALFEIGRLYENTRKTEGSAIPTEPVRAYAYYTLAEARHQKDAAFYRRDLGKKLTTEERINAEALVAQWPNMQCALPSTLKKMEERKKAAEQQGHAPKRFNK